MESLDGPAVIYEYGQHEWWIHGTRVSSSRSARLDETLNPATTPARLAALTRQSDDVAARLAAKHPNCPTAAKTLWVLTRGDTT